MEKTIVTRFWMWMSAVHCCCGGARAVVGMSAVDPSTVDRLPPL